MAYSIGTKLNAKLQFMVEWKISPEYRQFEIIEENEDGSVCLINKKGFKYYTRRNLLPYLFYITSNINQELLQLIEKDNIEFTSFNGVTIDGKIINIGIAK